MTPLKGVKSGTPLFRRCHARHVSRSHTMNLISIGKLPINLLLCGQRTDNRKVETIRCQHGYISKTDERYLRTSGSMRRFRKMRWRGTKNLDDHA
jgi:hypothetical protein